MFLVFMAVILSSFALVAVSVRNYFLESKVRTLIKIIEDQYYIIAQQIHVESDGIINLNHVEQKQKRKRGRPRKEVK